MSSSILFVDNDEFIREVIPHALKFHGYLVSVAANAQEAIKIFENRQQTLDIVITDFQMPGMNGLQLSNKIRSISSRLPIILSSCESILEKIITSAGINAFLKKPYQIEDVHKLVQKVLLNSK